MSADVIRAKQIGSSLFTDRSRLFELRRSILKVHPVTVLVIYVCYVITVCVVSIVC